MSLGVVGGGTSSSNTNGAGVSINPQQQTQSSNMLNMSMSGGTNMSHIPSSSSVGGGGSSTTNHNPNAQSTIDELLPLVMQLNNPDQREGVLLELSKKRESFNDLAPILWHTVGTVSALLQEIVSIYPLLSPPTLTAHASNRVCNALALLQCVASHQDTRSLFLAAHIPLYLYPFLNTQSKSRPFEYLRLTSLGVIGALVKMDDPDVINFLLQTEIIPLCLRIMETGSELSKTVATFIVQKILLDEIGLSYVCATAERFYAVSQVLNNMIGLLIQAPSVRLLKHIVRCYLRLSDNLRAREALKQCLPMSLRDDTFAKALRDDVTVKKWLSQLLNVVGPPIEGSGNVGMTGAPVGSGLNRFSN
jgi:CCR4-NOT transcription complex subunit 9